MTSTRTMPPLSTPDAADIEGLLWGYRFSDTGQAELLQGAALRAALEQQAIRVWLHFDPGDERSRDAIAALPHVPPAAVAMLLSADDRHRVGKDQQAVDGAVDLLGPAAAADVYQRDVRDECGRSAVHAERLGILGGLRADGGIGDGYANPAAAVAADLTVMPA